MSQTSRTSLHNHAAPMDADAYPGLRSEKGKALALLLRAEGFPVHRIASLWDCDHDCMAELISGSLGG